MESIKNREDIEEVKKIMGSNFGKIFIFYTISGGLHWNERSLLKEKIRVQEELEEYVKKFKKRSNEEYLELSNLLDSLDKSDWSNKESFLSFKKEFNNYTKTIVQIAEENKPRKPLWSFGNRI